MTSAGLPSETPIAYDMTRLFLGPLSRTPRGIDRVDFAFARHFLDKYENSVAVLPTMWGVRCFDRHRALRGLERLEALWAENVEPDDDPIWPALRAWLLDHEVLAQPARSFGIRTQAGRMMSLVGATGWSFGRSASGSVPRGAIYVNVGHLGLVVPLFLWWLRRRPDVLPVFMLHDVIPIQAPEYVEPGGVAGHERMVDMAARYAAAVIVTTKAAQMGVEGELSRRTSRLIPTLAQHLPVADIFSGPALPDPDISRVPYFVSCGAIEPRKNQLFLVELWKQTAAGGGNIPKLVIVGAPGWTGKALIRQMCPPALADRIRVVSGLSTPALIRLLKSARGLLMPSFAEGFGLPIAEAQCLGVPVIASDIPAHREIAQPGTILLSPLDGPGWSKAIEFVSAAPGHLQTPAPGLNWETYFNNLDARLASL